MKKIVVSLLLLGALVLPVMAMAQIGGQPPTINTSLSGLGKIIVDAVWLIFTVIVVIAFVIAGVKFFTAGGDPGKIAEARTAFIWGIAGVLVGILAFGMINFVKSFFGAGA